MNRSEARIIIMTILYQIELYKNNKLEYTKEDVIKENLEVDNEFVKSCVNGVLNHEKEIIDTANKYLNDWTLNRLGLTDQAIIKLGIYELLYTDTPAVVAINETVELAKKYSDEKVKNMINGVLDKIYHDNEDKEK